MEAAHLPWQHLGSLLINRGLLDVEQVKRAFEEQQLTGKRLGEIVVAHGWITSQDLARALAEQNGLEYVDPAHGRVVVDARHLGAHGAVQSGVYASMAESIALA